MTRSRRWRTALLAAALAPAVPAGAQQLGPKDSPPGLAPTDTARVAVGSEAPDFTLEALDGSRVTLSGFRGARTVVLVFYRGHW
jgi:cytochrome oxidase Cu insertion factor (SCO1/SenC/PrrC family)